MTDKILRKSDVEALVGLSERTCRRLEAEGRFPKRFLIDPDGIVVGWLSSEIDQ